MLRLRGCFLFPREWCPLHGKAFCPTDGDIGRNLEFRFALDNIAPEVIRVVKDSEHHQAEPAEFIAVITEEALQSRSVRPIPAREAISSCSGGRRWGRRRDTLESPVPDVADDAEGAIA